MRWWSPSPPSKHKSPASHRVPSRFQSSRQPNGGLAVGAEAATCSNPISSHAGHEPYGSVRLCRVPGRADLLYLVLVHIEFQSLAYEILQGWGWEWIFQAYSKIVPYVQQSYRSRIDLPYNVNEHQIWIYSYLEIWSIEALCNNGISGKVVQMVNSNR